ncbi:hypothetical protein LIS04_40 [Listeria phage LIS04]|nr:hypothetical protein LIS04_40 [Listeria phage LIS04]
MEMSQETIFVFSHILCILFGVFIGSFNYKNKIMEKLDSEYLYLRGTWIKLSTVTVIKRKKVSTYGRD